MVSLKNRITVEWPPGARVTVQEPLNSNGDMLVFIVSFSVEKRITPQILISCERPKQDPQPRVVGGKSVRRHNRMIYPISFSIPECKIVKEIPVKTQLLATNIPEKKETYIFPTEDEYYKDYQRSVFAITHKKAGWDCLRHYEILANGCIPYFTDLDKCPPEMLALFPKTLVQEAMEASAKPWFNPTPYIEKLLDYTRQHLTTEAMARYILTISNNQEAKSVLFISGDDYPDYLRCLTLHGFKCLFKTDCHDINKVPHLYDTFPVTDLSGLYGKGFSYARTLDYHQMRDDTRDTTLFPDIYSRRYDLVIFGSVHRGTPCFDLITQVYPPEKILYLCGEDGHTTDEVCLVKALQQFSPCFMREIHT